MQKIGNPIPSFFDARGTLIDDGQIYVGEANSDPQTNPIITYWDEGLTIVAEQPLRTLGGRIVNGSIPSSVYIAESDYSMRILDAFNVLVDYSPSVFLSGVQYQPLSSVLTALTALAQTQYGQSLLTLANQAALQQAVGISAFNGGTVSNPITKQGSGAFVYFNDSSLTSGRLFATPQSGGDPTSQNGDIWLAL